jgi:hypothetical protein
MSKGYDEKCYELAEHFLDGELNGSEESEQASKQSLAQAIQDAIELWFVGQAKGS